MFAHMLSCRSHDVQMSITEWPIVQLLSCYIVQMATLDKAEALLEDLRSSSWDAAVKDLDDVKQFAADQVSPNDAGGTDEANSGPAAKNLLWLHLEGIASLYDTCLHCPLAVARLDFSMLGHCLPHLSHLSEAAT